MIVLRSIGVNRLLAVALLCLSGCATGYHPSSFTGGYSDVRLDDGLYKVSYRGNGATSGSTAADFAMLRAAELALENGYPYFTVEDSSSHQSIGSHTDPVQVHANHYRIGSGYTKYSTTGGETTVYSKPSNRIIVRMHKENPGNGYDAEQIVKALRIEYGL